MPRATETKIKTVTPSPDIIELTVKIAVAYLAHTPTTVAEIPTIIRSIHQTLKTSKSPVVEVAQNLVPAVPVSDSITSDYIVCLEDGKRLKILKRHLASIYQLTPNEYRHRWGLPPDYPMTAPSYSAKRSTFAKASGLGRRPARSTSTLVR